MPRPLRADASFDFAAPCKTQQSNTGQTFTLATQAFLERLAWATGDANRVGLERMWGYAKEAIEVGRWSGYHFYLTYALREAGRRALARARHDAACRSAVIDRAEALLREVDERAEHAGYRLIEADAHVARAELVQLAGNATRPSQSAKPPTATTPGPSNTP